MASVNLNTLTEVQAAGTGDNLLLFNETSNVATRIDYDKLADAILDKLTTKTYSGISNNVIGAITNLDSRFFKAASGNITSDNIDSYTTSGLYLGYIESATITGGGGNSFGLLIVTNPSNTAVRIGQCIVMMPTGYIATRYNMNNVWSDWQQVPRGTEFTALQDRVTAMEYTPLFSQTYSTRAQALAALDAHADSIGNGSKICGYFNTATSNLFGLSNTSHYFDFYVNSDSYRLLVCRPLNGKGTFVLAKTNGTWGDSWVDNPVTWPSDTYVKITTSLETYIANHSSGMFYLWSTVANYTDVGAPDQNPYHYVVIKTNSSAAIIWATQMSNGATATMYMKQMYNNTWGDWVALAV